MKKRKQPSKQPRKQVRNLGFGDFLSPDQNQNTEIAGARWEFARVVRRVFPDFFEQLRDQVYPIFAPLADARPGYWEPGWSFETWQQHADPGPAFTTALSVWARSFHADEPWVLDGALQTLWSWHLNPKWRDLLVISGFRTSCCVDSFSSDEERLFTFQDQGWDPQLQRCSVFRADIKERFQTELDAYLKRLSSLMEERGAVRAQNRYSADHLEWFISYQLRGMCAAEILEERRELEGGSTILKGVKAAAKLMQWKNLRRLRKPRTRRSSVMSSHPEK